MLSHQAVLKLQQENRQLRRATEFAKFLKDVVLFLPEVKKPVCFISYAWENNKTQAGQASNAIWHARLSRIKEDLEFLGAEVFLDIYDMHGNMPAQMRENIKKSDFIFLIGTPRLMVRLTESPPTNAAFEWEEIKAKLQDSPHCLLPLLFEGEFGTAFPPEVSDELLVRDMRDQDAHETIIARLGNPMGILPNIFGLNTLHSTDAIMQRYRTSWERLKIALDLIEHEIRAQNFPQLPRPASPSAEEYCNQGMAKEKQGLLTDAFQAYLRAGQKGNTRGRTNAANFLLHGRGTAPDKLQAAKLFEESANEGHARAMLSLGVMYEKGDGVPANPVTAKT
ncbi:MAG: toll/interleukin-1 receptor domain-containing protein, partial [Gammaproteobacteria bacterium]